MAKALLHHLPVLEKSLQASQVVIDLRNQESGSFLSETEEKEIESKESDQKKAKKLLDILLTKESIAFYQFIEVIRRNPEKWCRKMVDDILYQAIFGESRKMKFSYILLYSIVVINNYYTKFIFTFFVNL